VCADGVGSLGRLAGLLIVGSGNPSEIGAPTSFTDEPENDLLMTLDETGNMTTTEDDDGVTVTWHTTPVGSCAVLISRPIDECPSCRLDGRCQHCGVANGKGSRGCTLPKELCQNRPCPMKSAPETAG